MKCVLIAQQGNGTHLLRALLNSHEDIYIDNEIFVQGRNFGEYLNKMSHLKIDEYLDFFYNKFDKKVVGFDLKYNQMELYDNKIIEYIKTNKIAVIHLLRDPARTFMRHINKHTKTSFIYEDVKNYCDKIRRFDKEVEKIFKNNEYLQITYEEMTSGREINSMSKQNSVNIKLSQFLDISLEHLVIDKNNSRKPLTIRY